MFFRDSRIPFFKISWLNCEQFKKKEHNLCQINKKTVGVTNSIFLHGNVQQKPFLNIPEPFSPLLIS